MMFRGLRGAITVDENDAEAIWGATRELLRAMIELNDINEEDVASVLFTATPDITAAYPARAARDLGWTQVALIDAQEMDVPTGIPMCIRVLLHWNTSKRNADLHHVFMRGATVLRPDLPALPANWHGNAKD